MSCLTTALTVPFVTADFAKRMDFPSDGHKTLMLSSFRSTPFIRTTNKVKVAMVADDGKLVSIPSYYIVPPIQSRFKNQFASLPHLRGLKLAHPVTCQEQFHINLLIGVSSSRFLF